MMISATAVDANGKLRPEFTPERYGVVVMMKNDNGERFEFTERYLFGASYGPNGQSGCVDAAENMQELACNITEDGYAPIATVYVSGSLVRELFAEVGSAEPEPHTIGCDCRTCLSIAERLSNGLDVCYCGTCIYCAPGN